MGVTSAATERALARVDRGETAYAAAKAEGIALSTIYRALRARDNDPVDCYYYDSGVLLARIMGRAAAAAEKPLSHLDWLTPHRLNAISMEPWKLLPMMPRTALRGVPLDDLEIPERPEACTRPNLEASGSFWLGLYHASADFSAGRRKAAKGIRPAT